MTGPLRWGLGVGLGAVSALVVAALSQAPYVPEPRLDPVLRLSWRSRGERVEHCRELAAEEQEHLPAHMRQRVVCEGRNAVYRLTVDVDGGRVLDRVAQGSGTRQRRPIVVWNEVRLIPGSHRIRVQLVREDRTGRRSGERNDEADEEESQAALPPRLDLETTTALEPRQVLLVTYDPDRRRLIELHDEPSARE